MPEDKGLPKSPRALREENVLRFWKDQKIFEKSLLKDALEGEFVFYEGPPTANGRPGIHHIESRSFKDAIPRYKTMRGFYVPRKAGWDTHGLPVELEVEKKLGLKSKKEIEKYGVAEFNRACRESVGTYIDEWAKFTDRIGFWVNQDEAYYTYNTSFIERVWSVLGHVEKRNLLYKDYKVVPWCPRCGTGLSSHELAQPGAYVDVKDLSVYAKFKVLGEENTFIFAWTTTPWTLPGNVALAVGEDIDYVTAKVGDEKYILAESRLSILGDVYEVLEKRKGRDLTHLSYEPLYTYLKTNLPESELSKLEKAFRVYTAGFVTTEDGTGVVHTAVMYGQDDFELGTHLGLPKYHTVDDSGHFKPETGFLSGKFVKDEETSVEIIKDLAHRGLLFKKEKYEHSYPHCWRCKTPLIYYARDSWYIRMSELRDELVRENEKINWEPDYIKEGRFGDWLSEVKDWAISRERYWGTPLPIWQSEDGDRIVVDSIDTLKKYTKTSGNTYFVMRHGGTEGNAHEVVSYKNEAHDHLTEEGRKGVEESAKSLKGKVDMIVVSPFARTRETAEIVREVTGIDSSEVIVDERLREINPGKFDGGPWHTYHEEMSRGKDWFTRSVPEGESLKEVQRRVGEALYDLEQAYQGKRILIITHGGPAWLLHVVAGLFAPVNQSYEIPKGIETNIFVPNFRRFKNAEVRELSFVPLPHDEYFTIDLHKPYIDDVVLEKNGRDYRRVKEVMDVWFDSGAMPFAQDPYNVRFPADFISEAIDQTRGWFYTLHAIGCLMEKGHAYRNVICLGHILDKEGKKMSKSVGNVVNPWEMIDKYGVDVVRLWMYSVNQPGESKNFDERTVDEIQKRVFNLLDNVHAFYELYRDEALEKEGYTSSENVLDLWITSRLGELVTKMTDDLDHYRLLEPVRDLRAFIDDLSTWYVRRSRDRLKEGDKDAKKTLYFVLKTLSKLLAPFAPFMAEDLYQKLRTDADKESVHLENWPEVLECDELVLANMKQTRDIVSLALEARSKANIKIRQPLSRLSTKLLGAYTELIKDEVNVKEVVDSGSEEVELDTVLTQELIEEGRMREIVRSIQEMRKEKNLVPTDVLPYSVSDEDRVIFEKYKDEIVKITNISLE